MQSSSACRSFTQSYPHLAWAQLAKLCHGWGPLTSADLIWRWRSTCKGSFEHAKPSQLWPGAQNVMLALALTHLVDVASVVFPCFPQIAVGADFEEFSPAPKTQSRTLRFFWSAGFCIAWLQLLLDIFGCSGKLIKFFKLFFFHLFSLFHRSPQVYIVCFRAFGVPCWPCWGCRSASLPRGLAACKGCWSLGHGRDGRCQDSQGDTGVSSDR